MFKNFSRKPHKFKYFSSLCEPRLHIYVTWQPQKCILPTTDGRLLASDAKCLLSDIAKQLGSNVVWLTDHFDITKSIDFEVKP